MKLLAILLILCSCSVDESNEKSDCSSSDRCIDLVSCLPTKEHRYLLLGSAWWAVNPLSSDQCEVWLGGEKENPAYSGKPTEYCLFRRVGTIHVEYSEGGPAHIKSGDCAGTNLISRF